MTRPTHATVPADLDAATLTNLTPGKTYPIIMWEAEGFRVPNDRGRVSYCLPEGCAHLNGRDWLLTTEPPAEDAATIARLERRVAVLREALEDVRNNSPDLPDERATSEEIAKWRAMWKRVDAALAETEGE